MVRKLVSISVIAFSMLVVSATAFAQDKVKPWIYDPDKTKIIDSKWIDEIGLPDTKGKKEQGLYFQKDGPTATNAAAGASVEKVKGLVVPAGGLEMGFDARAGFHCGAGAVRYNVLASDGFHFVGGCANGTMGPGPKAGWTRVRFNTSDPGQSFPVIAPGATIMSIDLVFDEGTDAGPDFTGEALSDNIDVNGKLITSKKKEK